MLRHAEKRGDVSYCTRSGHCSCLFITLIRFSLTSSRTPSQLRGVRLAYTRAQITAPAPGRHTVNIPFKRKPDGWSSRKLKLLLWWVQTPTGAPRCCNNTRACSRTRLHPTGKTRLANRDGDCSITMVTQMGPRERGQPALRLKWHTSSLEDAPKFPLSQWKTWMSVKALAEQFFCFFCHNVVTLDSSDKIMQPKSKQNQPIRSYFSDLSL